MMSSGKGRSTSAERKGHALLQERPPEQLSTAGELRPGDRLQGGVDLFVTGPDHARLGEHLVPCRTDQVVLEQVGHAGHARALVLRSRDPSPSGLLRAVSVPRPLITAAVAAVGQPKVNEYAARPGLSVRVSVLRFDSGEATTG